MRKTTSAKKILVLGANGRLGRISVRHLHNQGYAIRAACRNPRSAADFFRGLDRVEMATVDLSSEDSLEDIVRGCSLTVFAAGASRPCYSRRPEDAEEFRRINVEALKAVGLAVLHAGNHPLIHLGSLFGLGLCQSGGLTETTEACPDSPFELSEHEGELQLLRLFHSDGLDCRIMRLPPVLGAAPPTGLLAALRAASLQAKWQDLFIQHAKATKPLISSIDFLSALGHMLTFGRAGMVSNFASGDYQLAQIPAILVVDGTAIPPPSCVVGRPADRLADLDRFLAAYVPWNVRVRLDFAKNELRWTPAMSQ